MMSNFEIEKARRRVRSRPATDLANKCRRCGGPCRAWAGNTHGWTCRECLHRNLFGDTPDLSQVEALPLLSSQRSRNSIVNGVRLDADD